MWHVMSDLHVGTLSHVVQQGLESFVDETEAAIAVNSSVDMGFNSLVQAKMGDIEEVLLQAFKR